MLNIGVDVGGTFTDFSVFDENTGRIATTKTPTTSPDPLKGVIAGIEELEIDMRTVRRFVHGTTIATNAIVQRRGAKAAFITTRGFRDHIEIGDSRRYTGGQFDPDWVRTRPLIPRPLRFEVRERVMATGKVLVPLDEKDVLEVVEKLKRQKVESVAVGFIHSYAYPRHERRIGELLRRHLPEVPCTLSSDVAQEWREYPRFTTAVINAYVMPLLKDYAQALVRALRGLGYKGEVHFMTSTGGLATEDTVATYPVGLIMSGPAAGVMAGPYLGQVSNWKHVITYDMGGTSTDVSVMKDLSPELSTTRVLGAFPILTPMVDVNSIGAGGGSIAWVDATGALRVGPQSAGASPGPACYGQSGTEFTVTDANLLLGRISPRGLLGGKMSLRRDLAEEAARRLGDKVGIRDLSRLADGVIKLVCANMASAVRQVSIERGHDPRDFALVAFGGAGPLHAIPIVQELGIPTVLVPEAPGNFCALGTLVTDIKHDFVRTYKTRLNAEALPRVEAIFREMRGRGEEALRRDGVAGKRRGFQFTMFLRYFGQAWELEVPLKVNPINLSVVKKAFDKEHLRAYGYNRPDYEIELVNLHVTAIGRINRPALTGSDGAKGSLRAALLERRKVYFEKAFLDAPVYQRELLPPQSPVKGPAVIEEFGSVTVVFPSWQLTKDGIGNLVLQQVG